MLAGPCAAHMVCIVTPSIWAYPPMFLWFAIQSGCTYSTDDVLVTVLEFPFEGLPFVPLVLPARYHLQKQLTKEGNVYELCHKFIKI